MKNNPLKIVKQVQRLADNIIRIRELYQDHPQGWAPIAELVAERDAERAFDLAGAINHNVINNIATN